MTRKNSPIAIGYGRLKTENSRLKKENEELTIELRKSEIEAKHWKDLYLGEIIISQSEEKQ
jgi:hypothetical protein